MKLTDQASRVALLLQLIDSAENPGSKTKISVSDLRSLVKVEIRPNLHKRPCVVEFAEFESITDAARFLAYWRPDLWENSKAAQRMDAYSVMMNLIKRISRWCDSGDVPGYYWN